MGLLIDGYNLLHVSGVFGRTGGPGVRVGAQAFERSRVALLNFIAAAVEPRELPRTVVVFDAAEAPPGLPRTVLHAGVTVRYASDYESADDLLEELIRAEHAARQLTVVSSDHRVQRAARRRQATAVDSDVWYAAAVREFRERQSLGRRPSVPRADVKPAAPLSPAEVAAWLAEFGPCDLAPTPFRRPASRAARASSAKKRPEEEGAAARRPNAGGKKKPVRSPKKPRASPPVETKPIDDLGSPFPPGYGEDLL